MEMTTAADTTPRRSYRELLADRTFGPFFASAALSNTGSWFQNVAAGIVVFDLTGSNRAVGAVSIVQFTATMLLTPWAGGLTDRINRRWMLVTGQSIAFLGALLLAIYTAIVGIDQLPGPWPVYAATAIIGLGAAVILPSLQAVVPALVHEEDLDRAITLNSLTFNIARGVGPLVAGLVVATFGAVWAFGINTLSYVPLLLVTATLTPRGQVSPVDRTLDTTIRDGVRWVRERRTVGLLLLATLAVGWTSDPFSTLMPAMAEELGGGDATVGLLIGLFGLGAALTAPGSDRVRARVGRGQAIGVGLVGTSLGLLVVAVAPNSIVAGIGSLVAGSGFLMGVTSTNTELQRGIPGRVRGRVMALWSVAFLGCRPFAAIFDGTLADLLSVRTAVAVSSVVAMVTGIVFWRIAPVGADIEADD